MPNRIIRDSCKTSQSLAKLSAEAERLFWRLVTVADDFGRFEAEPVLLLAKCFPLKVQEYKLADVSRWYAELESCGHVQTYVSNCYHYGLFISWEKHQQCRAKTSKYPAPTVASICSQTLANALVVEDVVVNESVNEKAAIAATAIRWPSPKALMDLYNEKTPDEVRAAEELSPGRIKKAKEYLKDFPQIEYWDQVFANYHRSRFLRGLTPPANGHASFKADFDWLLSKGKDGTENFVKVHDGRYND